MEAATTDIPETPSLQNEETHTGESTLILDGTSTPSPRSTPAKASIFKKAASLQKVNLNKDFLKNFTPTNTGPQPGVSTTPRPMASEKRKIQLSSSSNDSQSTIIGNKSA
jgi:hypothetical protein